MADPFLERLTRALAPNFEVERVLGAGGMGIVVLAREVALGRRVAIKTIRPERCTAVALERFLREAQTLAGLAHPNIVPIHRHEMRDGLPCIVMAYLDGESLKDRLRRGPLPPAEVVRLGKDLLSALEVAHARGIVHRDIKPANVFLQPDRAVLADFGIAMTPDTGDDTLTATGEAPGTPAYMSPEQAAGRAGPATDIFALGLVLYEAATGRSWRIEGRAAAEWRGVPRPLVSVLRRALAPAPADRWPSAQAFRRALRRPRARTWVPWTVAAVGGALAALLIWCPWCPSPALPIPDVAIVPFAEGRGQTPGLGADLTEVVKAVLRPMGQRLTLVDVRPPAGDAAPAGAPRARAVVDGEVAREDSTTVLHLRIRDETGRVIGQRRVAGGEDRWAFGERIALAIVEIVRPGTVPQTGCRPSAVAALNAWLDGEDAFRRDDWRTAEVQFQHAVAADPDFCTAQFRLWLVQRWRRGRITVDLRHLLDAHGDRLPLLDRTLLAAELAPSREARRATYETALGEDPFSALAPLQYGAELMHRGPLDGIPLDSGVVLLTEATRRDPWLAPAHDQLVWALVRLGRETAARSALDALRRYAARPDTRQIDPAALALAVTARFAPESLETRLGAGGAGTPEAIRPLIRMGLSFDVAPAQGALGGMLVAQTGAPPQVRAHGFVARGLALLALGAPRAGMADLDSAASFDAELALQAAQWRVLAGVLGVPGVAQSDVDAARSRLQGLASDPRLGVRARWALTVATAGDAGSPTAAVREAGPALATISVAVAEGRADPAAALRRSASLRGVAEEQNRLGDAFARSVLHLARARWLDRTGETVAAEHERRWHENSDFEGWLEGAIQAAEVDWVVGSYVRWREGVRRVRAGDVTACGDARRILELWAEAEPAVLALADSGRALVAERCR